MAKQHATGGENIASTRSELLQHTRYGRLRCKLPPAPVGPYLASGA